jgi:hypothetical protein
MEKLPTVEALLRMLDTACGQEGPLAPLLQRWKKAHDELEQLTRWSPQILRNSYASSERFHRRRVGEQLAALEKSAK